MTDGDSPEMDFDGNDRGWLWFLVLAVPVVAFFISYIQTAIEQLDRAANPPGIRIGIVSRLFGTDAVIATIFGGLTFLVVLYFAYRYSAGNVAQPTSLRPHWGENTFRLLLLGIALIMIVTFMYAGTSLANTDQMPANVAMRKYNAHDELNMTVVGSQWAWRDTVQGVNYTQTDEVRLPAHTLVSVRITSADVDHSWAVEQLGIKKDAIPGSVTHTWMYVKKPGTYQVNCAELCGVGHSDMTQQIVVMPKQKYIQWARSHGYSVPFASSQNSSSSASASVKRPTGTTNNDLRAPGVSADV